MGFRQRCYSAACCAGAAASLASLGLLLHPLPRCLRAGHLTALLIRQLPVPFDPAQALGHEGSDDPVRRQATSWAKAGGSMTADAYVPHHYAPVEAYQFDRSHGIVLINGVNRE